jgi:hypothetical protein
MTDVNKRIKDKKMVRTYRKNGGLVNPKNPPCIYNPRGKKDQGRTEKKKKKN